MRLRTSLSLFALTLMLTAAACLLVTRCATAGDETDKKPAEEKKGPVHVEVAELTSGSLPLLLPCTGDVELKPEGIQAVSARYAGVVESVLCRNGDRVHKGALLIRFDDRLASAAREKARGVVEEARAELEKASRGTGASEAQDLQLAVTQAQSAYDQAIRYAERQRALAKDNLVPAKQLEEADRARDNASALLEATRHKADLAKHGGQPAEIARLKAKLSEAEADMETADLALSATEVRAERDGVLSDLRANPGQGVDVSALLAKIVDIQPANEQCILSVPIEKAGLVHTGQRVHIEISDDASGTTDSAWVIDSDTQSLSVNAASIAVRAIPADLSTSTTLVPGQSVRAFVEIGEAADGLLAPGSALVPGEDTSHFNVFVFGTDGKSHKHEVELLARSQMGGAATAEVALQSSEIHAGDLIVTDGAYNLPDNTEVTTSTVAASE